MAAAGSYTPIYQLKVVLLGAEPPIRRRLQVPASMKLVELHRALQFAMGWDDCHLHEFEIGGVRYGTDGGGGWGPAPKDERRTRLDRVARKGTRFTYEYDFGDSWEHEIEVEDVVDHEAGTAYPVCTAGERSCPPEDCGGVRGYEGFLAAVSDPDHGDHERQLEWVGGDFDPEHLDLAAVNRLISFTRRRAASRV